MESWFTAGFDRYPASTITALLLGWTGVLVAVWAGVIAAVASFLVFVLVSVFHVGGIGDVLGNAPPQATFFGGFVAAGVGAVGGFLAVYANALFGNPAAIIVSLVVGVAIALGIVAGYGPLEHVVLRLRGCRRLSRDEVRKLAPTIQAAADALNLGSLPRFAVSDELIPKASTLTRTIVLTPALWTTLDEGELRAVIAHELTHWKNADVIGHLFVWAAGWPMLLLYELGTWLAAGRVRLPGSAAIVSGLLAWVGRLIAFPAFLLVNFVLIPVSRKETRRSEYEADAAVKAAGMGDQLVSALTKLALFEPGGTGWERKLAATHPPTALRIEKLQAPKPDDAKYQEDELGDDALAGVTRGLGSLAVVGVAAVAIVIIVLWAYAHLPFSSSLPLIQNDPFYGPSAVPAAAVLHISTLA